MAEWHDATEEYLEAILEIEEEGTIPIRARLVERLGLSAPAVSETVNRLVEHGYAELLDDRSLRLTAKGREVATSIVRRHRLAERLLVDIIGLEWEKVHKEADRWEHAISADVEEKLVVAPRRPGDLPARQPDPRFRPQGRGPASMPLTQSQPGPVIVRRISEKVEIDDDAIAFLAGAAADPGFQRRRREHQHRGRAAHQRRRASRPSPASSPSSSTPSPPDRTVPASKSRHMPQLRRMFVERVR